MSLTLLAPAAWTEGAPCAETDPDLWFPERGEDVNGHAAKNICRSCHVRMQCLSAALRRYHEEGIWGGYTEHERRLVVSRLRAGESLAAIVAGDDAAFYARLESAPDLAERGRESGRRARARNQAKVAAITQSREAAA